ncbi:ribosome biogenesis protein SLX9-domain-containing protein [Mycena galopus ATCC 62051]|nr:ribosome biogenesis protein SLX9-domain-containing protein [Mycena galopus ATCC 62051]
MPKDRRKRVGGHEPSVKLVKRQFAVQDNAVDHVEIGGGAAESAVDLLANAEDPHAGPVLKKKEKQQLKREALLQRLESSHSPYSKSHERRLKRKAKEQLAGGDLDAIQMAIAAVDDDEADAPELLQPEDSMVEDAAPVKQKKQKPKPGQIGEGKGATLSKAQRKRALELEKARHPLILNNSDFALNPFQTIRTHAQNTLLQH